MIHRRPFLLGAAAAGAGLATRRVASAADRMTVILDWLLDANHAALFAALQSGAFARAGLDVALVAPSDPDSPCRLVAAGQADLAIGYGTQINMLATAGLPVLRVATLIDRPLNTVMALGDGSIRRLADLKGRTVGVSVSGVEEALLDVMLQSAGLVPTDVTVVKLSYGTVAALLSGRLDAAIGAYRNDEVLQVRDAGRAPQVFLPEEHGVPPYDELILVARTGQEHDPRLGRFLAALREGTRTLAANPDAMWRAFAAAHAELATPFNRESWIATMPAIAADPVPLDRSRYLAFQSFAVAHGIVDRSLPLDRFAVQVAV